MLKIILITILLTFSVLFSVLASSEKLKFLEDAIMKPNFIEHSCDNPDFPDLCEDPDVC